MREHSHGMSFFFLLILCIYYALAIWPFTGNNFRYLFLLFWLFPILNFSCKNYSSNRVEYFYICMAFSLFGYFLATQIWKFLTDGIGTSSEGKIILFSLFFEYGSALIVSISLFVQYLFAWENVRREDKKEQTDFDKLMISLRNIAPLCIFQIIFFLIVPIDMDSLIFYYEDISLAVVTVELVKVVGQSIIPPTARALYQSLKH